MDTEQVVAPEAAAPTSPGVEDTPPSPDQEADTPSIPKPRFDEVLTRAKVAEEEARQLKAHVQTLQAQRAPTPQQQQIPTLDQALQAYEKGQITEGQKDQWVYYHSVEAATQKVGQAVALAAEVGKAQATIAEYVTAMPGLKDATSEEYQAYEATRQELMAGGEQETWNLRAKALRMTFGRLKSGAVVPGADHTRERADTFVEGVGGGGPRMNTQDSLKNATQKQLNFWKSKGYSRSQMEEEMKLRGVQNIRDYDRVAKKKGA